MRGKLATTELFHRVSSGRRSAIGDVIVLYEPLIEYWVRCYLGVRRFDREGEDLLQSIRLTLVEQLPRLRQKNQQSVIAWLRRVVRTKIVDWNRASRVARRSPSRPRVRLDATHAPDVASSMPSPTRIVRGREQLEQLKRAIEFVPARYQSVLRFICENEPTPDEIAAHVGKRPDAARKFTARALEHLRRALRSSSAAGS